MLPLVLASTDSEYGKQLSEEKINSSDCQETCYRNLLVKFLLSNYDSRFTSYRYKNSFLSSLCSLVIPTQ